MSVSPSVDKNNVMTYLSLYLIANKTLEFVHENAPVHYFEMKKNANFLRRGNSCSPGPSTGREGDTPSSFGAFGASILAPSALDPQLLLWQIEHWCGDFKCHSPPRVLPQILRLDLRGHIAAGEREGKGRKEAGRQERHGSMGGVYQGLGGRQSPPPLWSHVLSGNPRWRVLR